MNQRGLTFVELLVTLVVLTVGLGALLRALATDAALSTRLQRAVQARYETEARELLVLAKVPVSS